MNFMFSNIKFISSRHRVISSIYCPTQIRFPIGRERVTCHRSKLNDSLGRTKLNKKPMANLNFGSHMIRSSTLKRRQISVIVGLVSKSH